MEEKINIAEILKDKPQGTKLYSLTYGDCFYQEYTGDFGIECRSKNRVQFNLDEYGRYCIEGECILFPSKEMRDWLKFAWKKGDVLISNDYGTEVIFYDWYDDTYTNFYGKHYLNSEDKNNIKYNDAFLCTTERYSLEDRNAAQTYINTIEERLGGKLNLETLEIEKQPEFKDGDIVMSDSGTIVLVRGISLTRKIYYHAYMRNEYIYINQVEGEFFSHISRIKRFATDSEKQQLFDALAKEGKVWDAERKDIVDLKPKWITLKPFDKVLVRDGKDEIWEPAFFFRNRPELNIYKYQTVGGKLRVYCIPFNEETAKLIGTTKEWKE